jgi:hypothetical protein
LPSGGSNDFPCATHRTSGGARRPPDPIATKSDQAATRRSLKPKDCEVEEKGRIRIEDEYDELRADGGAGYPMRRADQSTKIEINQRFPTTDG